MRVLGTLSTGVEENKAFCIGMLGSRGSLMDKTDSKGTWDDKVELRTFGVCIERSVVTCGHVEILICLCADGKWPIASCVVVTDC